MTRSKTGSLLLTLAFLFALCCFVQPGLVIAQEEGETEDDATEAEAEVMEPEDDAEEAEEAEEAEPEVMEEAEEAEPEVMEEATPPPPTVPPAGALDHPTGAHHPPTQGKFVGDHWTPYDPPDPETFPPNSEFHILEPGDTLWDLAERYLQSAWLWPQLWDVNQYILDSHWIYPGDPLLIVAAPEVIAEAEPTIELEPVEQFEEEVFEEPEPEPAPVAPALPPPPSLVPIAQASDVYCSNYITEEFIEPELFIEEREEGAKSLLSRGDIVYLSQGADAGITPGTIYSVIRPDHDVFHPTDDEVRVGTSVRSIGRLQVLAVQDETSTAEVLESCNAVAVGQFLVPFEEVSVPVVTPEPFRPESVQLTGENAGYIVHAMEDPLSFGEGAIVNIDMGTQDGVQAGDRFTVYRQWGGTVEFASAVSYIDEQQRVERIEDIEEDEERPDYPPSILGQLIIIGTRDNTATARILDSVREMAVGDRVELR